MPPSLQPAPSISTTRPGWPIQLHLTLYLGLLALMLALFTLGNAILPATEDVTYYYEYSRRIMLGQIPYHDFPLEYPPFALVFFLLPWLVLYPAGGLQGEFYANRDFYAAIFHLETFVLEAATLLLAYRLLRRLYPSQPPTKFTTPLIWYTLGALAISLYMLQRFDIGAAFLLLLGLYWLYLEKPALGGIALGLGTAAKLYPAVALPLALLYLWRYQGERRAAWRCLAGFVIAGLVVTLPTGIEGIISFLKYHSDRGIQIESIYASIAVLGHYLGLYLASSAVDHVSIGVASPISGFLASFSTLLTIGGLLLIYALAWRKMRNATKLPADWLIQATALAVLWFVLANKVFSPQYMIWLLAFVPFWKKREAALLLVALLLSFIPFPLYAAELFQLDWKPMLVLVIRNGLLLAILVQAFSVVSVKTAAEEVTSP